MARVTTRVLYMCTVYACIKIPLLHVDTSCKMWNADLQLMQLESIESVLEIGLQLGFCLHIHLHFNQLYDSKICSLQFTRGLMLNCSGSLV